MNKEKYLPKVGDQLYLRQRTGNEWADMVKRPYTVINVSNSKVVVQKCKLIFNGPSFYCSIADDIVEDPNGSIEELSWKPSLGCWGTKGSYYDYPYYAVFGKWEHYPYLN